MSATLVLALTGSVQANLILNGGFENSAIGHGASWDIGPWSQGGGESNRIIDGLASEGGSPNENWIVYPLEGLREYRLQGSSADYYIEQTIALPAGDYALSAWFAGRNNYSVNYLVTSTVALELRNSGGTVITPGASSTPAIPEHGGGSQTGHWVNWTRDYSSLAAGDYTVRVTKGSSGVFQQGWVDDVSLTLIPEPSTIAMATIGLLALGLYGRRRWR